MNSKDFNVLTTIDCLIKEYGLAREVFLGLYRENDDLNEQMSEADCKEVFLGILKGGSDLDRELLEDLANEYNTSLDEVLGIKTNAKRYLLVDNQGEQLLGFDEAKGLYAKAVEFFKGLGQEVQTPVDPYVVSHLANIAKIGNADFDVRFKLIDEFEAVELLLDLQSQNTTVQSTFIIPVDQLGDL